VHLILSHENADFDAVASMLAAHKLYPDGIPVLAERLNRNVANFLALYRNGLPFVAREDYRAGRIESITLVDVRQPPQLRGIKAKTPRHIIDHHPLDGDLADYETFTGEVLGANTSVLVEELQRQKVSLNTLEATLLTLGIYEDTGSLLYGRTTARDIRAAAWLVEQGASLDTVRRFLEPPLDEEQRALLEKLIATSESRVIAGYTIIIGAANLEQYLSEISAVAHRLRDTLDPAALFMVVQMPNTMHLVCRSSEDAIDAGEIAREFGGGGHGRAAAATLRGVSLEQAVHRLWTFINTHVHAAPPLTRVADLMSYGVQTLNANVQVGDVVRKMRRIGHEGFPVLENGRVVGLLTRRDADRAVEHGLGQLTVREIMTGGNVTLSPDDPVSSLEQRMVESGWGQIPVLSEDGRLIGIVTRTDLIKHWARTHPTLPAPPPDIVTEERIFHVLGKPAGAVIDTIAEHAQQLKLNVFMVGGVVRDLVLGRQNLDIDFVVEGDAIEFAGGLCARFGGEISSFRPFGTAKWKLDQRVADTLRLVADSLPDHVDFATARNEFYEHPTALPTVYSGSIKLDLGRRDFTINTLALQLSPVMLQGHILDHYGGLRDLHERIIRALHSLSFVDDPTRILRAIRFERRLNFTIEPRTAELMQTAMPMLGRITGERVRNELTLLLRESEPAQSLLLLQGRGILKAIHPAFIVHENIMEQFDRANSTPLFAPVADITDLYWHIIALHVPLESLADFCERLMFGKTMSESMLAAARLAQEADSLTDPNLRPSHIVQKLEGIPDLALLTVRFGYENLFVQNRIQQYATEWRHVRPKTDGHALRERGLPPGPCYGQLLNRLRVARLDGEVEDDREEVKLLDHLLGEGFCNDGA
jgi:tRNA nucleotidyltransferase (CCA-adding enzyme)